MNAFAWPSRQRGAIAMMTAVFMSLALICLVLVVDTGRLYYEQRSLQRIADSAALDAATEGGLCSLDSGPSLTALAAASASRNGFAGNVASAPNQVLGGYVETVAGIREFTPDAGQVEAVQVVLGKDVPASLVAGGLFGNVVPLRAQATAQRLPSVTFNAGSALLNIDSSKAALLNPLLSGLLGTSLNLGAVSYQGIANADVSLLEFMQSAGLIGTRITAGSVEEALASSISLAGFSAATVAVLADKQVAGAGLLGSQMVGVKNATLKLGDIVALESGPGSMAVAEALQARVNVLELLLAGAMAANRNNAVALNFGVAGLSASLRVIEPPVTAVGWPGKKNGEWRTKARTAQLRLTVAASPAVIPGLLAGDIALTTEVAPGEAWFEQARCRTLAHPSTDIDLAGKTGLASIRLGNTSGTGDAEVQLAVGAIPLVRAEVGLNTTVGASNVTDLDYEVMNRNEDLPEKKTMSAGNGLATRLNNLGVRVTFPVLLELGPVTALVKNIVVDGVVNDLVNPLVIPLLNLLGVQPGVMDVVLVDVREGPAVLLR